MTTDTTLYLVGKFKNKTPTYPFIPDHLRRAARKLAQELLASTPAAPANVTETRVGGYSFRGKRLNAVVQPEKLEAALIYCDGKGKWWGALVFQTFRGGLFQDDMLANCPAHSREEVFHFLQAYVRHLKGASEDSPTNELDASSRQGSYPPPRYAHVQSRTVGRFCLAVRDPFCERGDNDNIGRAMVLSVGR